MIILEGPDGAGKSTLGRILENELGLKVFHPGGAPDFVQFTEYCNRCNEMLRENYVCDRVSQISEYVYGPITNGRTMVSTRDVEDYLDFLRAELGVLVIYCKSSNIDKAKDKLQTKDHKPEEFLQLVKDNHAKIVAAYDHLFALPAAERLRDDNLLLEYDYTSVKSVHKILRAVKEKCDFRGLYDQ
ncbi:MAG: hypothetical protein ACK6DA_01190 [Candidatus Kapaibacterium sp.]